MSAIQKRCDFVLLFDVQDGNPNGDPDAGNMPRVDPETGHGLVTDVCLKRKLRDYVLLRRGAEQGFDVYVKHSAILNELHLAGYRALGITPVREETDESPQEEGELAETSGKKGRGKGAPKKKQPREDVEKVRQWMCQRFFDVRAFGAVMATDVNAGIVRGPVQLTFARSVDPIVSLEHSITRVAITREADRERKTTEMGRKATIPYGLYVGRGFVSPSRANGTLGTGFSNEDLALLWDGLLNMFEHDRSAARGLMNTRKLIIFEHDSELGRAPAVSLFEKVQVRRKDASVPPRAFSDYVIDVPKELPDGVKMTVLPAGV